VVDPDVIGTTGKDGTMPVGSYCRRPARTITAGESVRVAAGWMEKQRVGALVVVDGSRPVGLLTDRDIALRVVADGQEAGSTKVGSLALAPPATLEEDLSLRKASARMRRLGIRRMPVVDADGCVVGMLTADDLVRLVSEELVALADVASEQVPHSRAPVAGTPRSAAHYAKEVVTVGTEASARNVAERMRSESIGSVVVVDGSGAPVGIITDRDLTQRVVAKGAEPEATPASAIMSAQLATVDVGESLPRVAKMMSEAGIRRIPVVDDGRLTGIVTYDDLLVALGRELHDLGEAARAATSRELLSARTEEVAHDVERAVGALGGWIEQLEDDAKRALRGQLDALIGRLGGPD
jgi:signal-transduction protein with cAMP-binding, CBS, and nucleotidyltransferase domain